MARNRSQAWLSVHQDSKLMCEMSFRNPYLLWKNFCTNHALGHIIFRGSTIPHFSVLRWISSPVLWVLSYQGIDISLSSGKLQFPEEVPLNTSLSPGSYLSILFRGCTFQGKLPNDYKTANIAVYQMNDLSDAIITDQIMILKTSCTNWPMINLFLCFLEFQWTCLYKLCSQFWCF